MLLLMTILGREEEVVPVGLRLKYGAVATLVTNFNAFPLRLKVGAVPLSFELVKFSRLRTSVPARSFVTVKVLLAA